MTTLEEIYRAHSRDVYRFACWLCGNAAEAEDIVSETFLRLWGSREDLHLETVRAYVLTIARNVYLTRRRRAARQRPLPSRLVDHSPPPDVEAEGKDDVRAAMDALQSLPDGERTALLMRVQQDLPYDEIARVLGISVSAVKVRIHRARLKLAQMRTSCGEQP
jgi:RNA polymerase sigma-70 factor (ECF subfamily)